MAEGAPAKRLIRSEAPRNLKFWSAILPIALTSSSVFEKNLAGYANTLVSTVEQNIGKGLLGESAFPLTLENLTFRLLMKSRKAKK